MTIKELRLANRDMLATSMCVIHCSYDDAAQFSEAISIDDILKGCIIYEGEYRVMPKVLKSLNVTGFKCSCHTRSFDEPIKWDIWVE